MVATITSRDALHCYLQMSSASNLISEVLRPIRDALQLKSEEKVAVLVNNLGGLSQIEQWVAAGIIRKQIGE